MLASLSFAPMELGLICDRCSYKHYAPTELTRFGLRPRPRCVSAVNKRSIHSPRRRREGAENSS
jgi:hypothetical protein